MKKSLIGAVTALALSTTLFTACNDGQNSTTTTAAAATASAEPVTITIAGAWTDCKAVETVGAMFTSEYPNCTVVYENINDYYVNLPKRMEGEDIVDIFFVSGLQASDGESAALLPYAVDFNAVGELDLSDTFEPLMENYYYREDTTKMYSIPLGAEMRGMFVNTTLLESVGITDVPTNQSELLADCQILKDKGYIPMQGNPGAYGQWLVYPWIASNIANAEDYTAAMDAVNNRDVAAITAMMTEPLEFLYNLTANYFYDYKTAQKKLDLFNDSTEEDHARFFFNIVKDGEAYKKKDDTAGQIAFMPAPMSYLNTMKKTKEYYNSDIEYTFIPAPVDTDGGYVYLSAAHSIAANKNSPNLEWSIKFLNYLFSSEVNKVFAEEFNVMPNVQEIFEYVSSLYDVPTNHICHLGQVTFTWSFYDAAKSVIVEASKANKPDTVEENGGKLHEFSYYLDMLEEKINAVE